MKSKLISITVIGVLASILYIAVSNQHGSTSLSGNITDTLVKNTHIRANYIIDSQKFSVPANYQFAHSLFHGAPSASKAKNVDVFSISVLLPNLEPMTKVNKHDFANGGWGKKIDILVKKNNGVKPLGRYFSDLKKMNGLLAGNENSSVSGLLNFTLTRSENAKPDTWANLYVKSDYENEPYFLALCKRYTKQIVSPSCFVRYQMSSDLLIEYRMHIKYINDWENINNKITTLVKSYMINDQ